MGMKAKFGSKAGNASTVGTKTHAGTIKRIAGGKPDCYPGKKK